MLKNCRYFILCRRKPYKNLLDLVLQREASTLTVPSSLAKIFLHYRAGEKLRALLFSKIVKTQTSVKTLRDLFNSIRHGFEN